MDCKGRKALKRKQLMGTQKVSILHNINNRENICFINKYLDAELLTCETFKKTTNLNTI